MQKQKLERWVLVALLGTATVMGLRMFRGRAPISAGSSAYADNGAFQPLKIHEPELRLDLLENLRKLQYSGSHRDIFHETAPPPPHDPAPRRKPFVFLRYGPEELAPPPPPPPLDVPAKFFGYATMSGGRRIAFFTVGDDIQAVAEGDAFLNRFRLIHVQNSSVDVEEISSERHATLEMVKPPAQAPGMQPNPGQYPQNPVQQPWRYPGAQIPGAPQPGFHR